MIFAIDFDDTLCFSDNSPNFPLIEKLIMLRKKGHNIILWTCRGGNWLQEAIDFCKDCGLEFDAINENIKDRKYNNVSYKVVADLYIDNKAPGSIQFFMENF